MNNQQGNLFYFVNLDLLLDLYSLYFSVLRTHFSHIHKIKLSNHLKKFVEQTPFLQGFKNILSENLQIRHINQESEWQNIHNLFQSVALTAKPQIGAVSFKWLGSNGIFREDIDDFIKQISTLTNNKENNEQSEYFLFEGKIELIQKFHENLILNKVHIKNNNLSEQDDTLVYTQLLENIPNFFGSYRKFEDLPLERIGGLMQEIKWPPQEFKLSLFQKPTTEDVVAWKYAQMLESQVKITSQIVKGFGRGGKQLGIPTANLEITEEISQALDNLITGVYFGHAQFVQDETYQALAQLDYSKTYKMVMSIGYNPYFDNTNKTAEVYIMDQQFDEDFYGALLQIDIIGFLRSEANFKEFDHLIKAIHCDVYMSSILLK